jgi:hypothetical protein
MTATGEPASVADELRKLVELRDEGVLTTEQFEAQKGRLLATSSLPSAPTTAPGTWPGPPLTPMYPQPDMSDSPPRPRTWAWVLLAMVSVLLAIIVIGVIIGGVVGHQGSGGGSGSPVPIGTAIPFSFSAGGTADITVTQVVAPATAGQYQLQPSAGDEYVGVQVTVANTSSTNMLVDLGPMTALSDSSGQSFSWSPTAFVRLSRTRDRGHGHPRPGFFGYGLHHLRGPHERHAVAGDDRQQRQDAGRLERVVNLHGQEARASASPWTTRISSADGASRLCSTRDHRHER